MTERRDDAERDARLVAALRHAPDRDAAPPAELTQRILASAQASVHAADRRAEPGRGAWWRDFAAWLLRPATATAFATVALATVVGVMWQAGPPADVGRPLSDAADAAATAGTPGPATADALPPTTASSATPPDAAMLAAAQPSAAAATTPHASPAPAPTPAPTVPAARTEARSAAKATQAGPDAPPALTQQRSVDASARSEQGAAEAGAGPQTRPSPAQASITAAAPRAAASPAVALTPSAPPQGRITVQRGMPSADTVTTSEAYAPAAEATAPAAQAPAAATAAAAPAPAPAPDAARSRLAQGRATTAPAASPPTATPPPDGAFGAPPPGLSREVSGSASARLSLPGRPPLSPLNELRAYLGERPDDVRWQVGSQAQRAHDADSEAWFWRVQRSVRGEWTRVAETVPRSAAPEGDAASVAASVDGRVLGTLVIAGDQLEWRDARIGVWRAALAPGMGQRLRTELARW